MDRAPDSYRLFSLDPDEVLDAAAELLKSLVPGVEVTVVPMDRLSVTKAPDLPESWQDLVDQALSSMAPALSADRGRLAQPLVTHHIDPDGALTSKDVGVAIVESAAPLPASVLETLKEPAERAAAALEHALLYEVQAQIAQQLQRRLLPREKPTVAGLAIGTLFCPRTAGADIGGDFIDFVSLSPNQVAVSVGDVSGKGIAAAAVTVIAKFALRAITATLSWPTWPGEALRDLHNALQGQLDPESFVTVVFGTIDVGRRTVSLASAGHPSPYIIRPGSAEQPMILTAPAIALVDYSELEPLPTERISLEPGNTVLFFTDGLSELRDAAGRFYEEQRLPSVLADLAGLPPDELVERLYRDAVSWAERPPHDDIALVAVRLLP